MWKPSDFLARAVYKGGFWQVVACLFEAAGAGKPALRSLEKALQKNPRQADLHLQASRIYLKMGQVDQAALHCKKAASGLGPGSFLYWLDRASNGGIKPHRWDELEIQEHHQEDFSTKVECSGGDRVSEFNNSGLYLLEMGRYREALACFQQSRELGGNDPAISFNTGLALSKMDRHQEALDFYTEAQSQGFSSPELLNNKGYSLFYLARYEEALVCYEVARQYLPRDLGLLSNMASCYHQMGRVEEAQGCYRSAIKACPHDGTLHNNLGVCLEKMEKVKEALECYRKAVECSPRNCTFLLNLAECLFRLNRLDETYGLVEQILDYEPNHYQAWGLRGEILVEQGKMREAAECYGKALGIAV
ncbi:tetratricopeptide repeat protein [Desulforamulus ruminis]|uniref:Tetratricopeptide TPR_1 repeat-containing protein n=1 Tax=Desulforamulus ruminis (strain ATCC 23193 / DSM 2154 / NCIMB 8452 / DL) TaxID=696281 RepID=F6DLC2_DESRL|nr:tetratricopeptide repeat protein [Desulforamulus ruminis]AEG60470.1 Tetratricopeptide TPR_1 repeat-containing protein [Desulforamulus ruminis DSM 2154]